MEVYDFFSISEGEEMERDDRVNGQILGIPISVSYHRIISN